LRQCPRAPILDSTTPMEVGRFLLVRAPAVRRVQSAPRWGADRIEQRIRDLEPTLDAVSRATRIRTRGLAVQWPPTSVPPSVVVGHAPVVGGNGAEPDDRDDERVNLLLGRGQSLLTSGQVEQALACFDEVIAREPRHAEALLKKGMVLEQQEKYKEALDYYDRAIDGQPFVDAGVSAQRGRVQPARSGFDEALQCYEQALRLQQLTGTPSAG